MRRPAALLLVTVLSAAFALPQAAFAHGDGESEEAYLLVQQALAHLAHDEGSDEVDLAMEKVDDALAAEDQEGVDVAGVENGMRALEAGRVEQARTLLQGSISEAVAELPAATGYDTGTTVVDPTLAGRDGLDGTAVGLLLASVVAAGAGLVLTYRFRPPDSLRELRRRLASDPSPGDGSALGTPAGGGTGWPP